MQARLRRLQADHQRVAEVYLSHPLIRVIGAEGQPPARYQFDFKLKSLVPNSEGGFAVGQMHRAEIYLPLEYPRRPPICRMLTPVFHPNISPQKICIGDHWSAGESLVHLVARIGQMLCFQSYNVQSPLNGQAAAWVEANASSLPLESHDLLRGL